jgi:hypothetical protein
MSQINKNRINKTNEMQQRAFQQQQQQAFVAPMYYNQQQQVYYRPAYYEQPPIMQQQPVVCSFYEQSRCRHGDNGLDRGVCSHSHPTKECLNIKNSGNCPRGELCKFKHPNGEGRTWYCPPARYFVKASLPSASPPAARLETPREVPASAPQPNPVPISTALSVEILECSSSALMAAEEAAKRNKIKLAEEEEEKEVERRKLEALDEDAFWSRQTAHAWITKTQ